MARKRQNQSTESTEVTGESAAPFRIPRGRALGNEHFWAYLSPLAAFVLVISYCNIRGFDIWWHIKTGEWIARHKAIPSTDPFSFTAAGQPWVSHEWLFGLLSYAAHAVAGAPGIVLAKGILVAGVLAIVAWVARVRGADGPITLSVLTAAYAIARARFVERPELLSLLLAAAFLLSYEKARTRPAWLGLLPVLQLIWVNGHGGTAALGCAMAGAFLVDKVCEIRRAAGSWNLGTPDFARCAAGCGGVLAVSFLNPHGYKALTYGLLRGESPIDNTEFQSVMELAAKRIDLSIALAAAFTLLLVLCFLSRPSRVRVYEWLLLPLLVVLTVVFFRFRPFLVLLMAPSLAWHAGHWNWIARVRRWLPIVVSAALMARVAAIEHGTYFYRFGPAIHSGVFPVDAVKFLETHRVSGNMFNSYALGGYLIWSLGPDRKVFIDGREDVYLDPGVLSEYVHAFDSPETWRQLVGKYGIDYAIVQYPDKPPANSSRSLDSLAFPRSDWGLVYFNDVAAIYVRRNGRNDSALHAEIRTVQPMQLSGYLDAVVTDPVRLELFREELAQNARAHPHSFRNRFSYGLLALKLGAVRDALGNFEEAAGLNPDFVPAHLNAGSIYLHTGRLQEAETAFRKALSLEANAFAAEQLAKTRSLRGRR